MTGHIPDEANWRNVEYFLAINNGGYVIWLSAEISSKASSEHTFLKKPLGSMIVNNQEQIQSRDFPSFHGIMDIQVGFKLGSSVQHKTIVVCLVVEVNPLQIKAPTVNPEYFVCIFTFVYFVRGGFRAKIRCIRNAKSKSENSQRSKTVRKFHAYERLEIPDIRNLVRTK